MHLAVPMRKNSNPPPYNKKAPIFQIPRRKQVQTYIGYACVLGVLLFILVRVLGRADSSGFRPFRTSISGASVVIVTVLDNKAEGSYLQVIRQNRQDYAKKQGYETFFPYASDYELDGAPVTWAPIAALRHALIQFPASRYIWYLHQDALVMNHDLEIEKHIMNPQRLEDLMLTDQPIIPPDSVIKTYAYVKGNEVDLVLTQDNEGLSRDTLILRNGLWSRYFIDTWFDPLYRSYNFAKEERHALQHMMLWHPTILSKLALVPQQIMNSYSVGTKGVTTFKEGDFVVNLYGCGGLNRGCHEEANKYLKIVDPAVMER